MNRVPVTSKGAEILKEELNELKTVIRPKIVEAIATAREHGDLKENAEYHAAKEQQSFIEGRILELESVTGRAQIIDPRTLNGDTIKFGATVTIDGEETDIEETHQIVGNYESDMENRKLSISAPVARALIGKSEGDSVSVKTPKGISSYEILDVKFI